MACAWAHVRGRTRVGVRVLAPRDFGAVASGSEALAYSVQWRPLPADPEAPRGPWRDAVRASDGLAIEFYLQVPPRVTS